MFGDQHNLAFFNRQFIKMRFLQYVPKECDIYVFPIRLEKKNVGNNATIKKIGRAHV